MCFIYCSFIIRFTIKFILITRWSCTGFIISTLDLFKLIFEVLQLEENIHLSEESRVVSHYKISPYSFQPKESKKLVPKKFIDIGQGVLEIIHEIEDAKN